MKIVIDIDEHIYEQIMADSEVYVLDNEVDRILIENAIYDGTPLPEHRGRYKPIILQEHDAEPRRLRAILDTATDEIYVCKLTRQGAEILGMTIEIKGSESE